jgi:hypothetical protein
MTMRMAAPRALQVQVSRAVGRTSRRGCPGPGFAPRTRLRYRKVATVRRAAVSGRLTLKLRLKPGLYRVIVRAQLDGGGLAAPLQGFVRVRG